MTQPPHAFANDVDRLRRVATRMDSAFRVPLVGVRIGWDSIFGLVPGIGDALTLLPAAYIIRESHRLGAPSSLLARMGVNLGIDAAIGVIPVLGDLFDVGWKANIRNVDLLNTHLAKRAAAAPDVRDVEGQLSSHHPALQGTPSASNKKGR